MIEMRAAICWENVTRQPWASSHYRYSCPDH